MANKLISGHIKQATQEAFLPSSLRTEFGEAMAVEISKTYRIADKTDEALGCLLYELRQAGLDVPLDVLTCEDCAQALAHILPR